MGIRKLGVVLLKFSQNFIDFSWKDRNICLKCFGPTVSSTMNVSVGIYIAHTNPELDMVTMKLLAKQKK